MKLLTPELRIALLANNLAARDADHVPVVKLFVPWSNATWLLTEMEPDGRCFGLCDLGLGEPELGYVSVEELESIRGPAGLTVERDLYWHTEKPLSVWTTLARQHRRITKPD
ncbi:DUF2958 domain-containing protein [Shinella sp. S4-D37]|uniref:DUF2958 domain-containing protein n=1 Tax=Shinella sp. S4-D37 TaxID=3161999 RepID=UPI0034675F98